MRPITSAVLAAFLLAAPGAAFANGAPRATNGPSLPPGEEAAAARLESSPRHGEFVDVPYRDGLAIRTWVVYPERKEKAGVVLVIQEIYGLTDWLRAVADQLAADGFIGVAPDLLSGMGPGGGGTDSIGSRDEVVRLTRSLTPAEIGARLDAVRAWAEALPAGRGRVATLGFCFGGAVSFAYAAAEPPPAGAVVFYGPSPDSARIGQVRAPVIGFYGADDARVNATIAPARAAMKARKVPYEVHVYDGAGHGFLRQQDGRDGANLRASEKAWPRAVAFLRKHLGR